MTVPKLENQVGRKAHETRQLLLNVAARLFAQHGYAGTSTTDILRAAGLTKGAMYFHFRSKEALARAVIEDRQLFWRHLAADVARRHPQPVEQLVVLTDEVAQLYQTDRSAVAAARLSAELVDLDPAAPRPYAGWVGIVTSLMAAAQENGDFVTDVPAETMAAAFVAAFVGAEAISGAWTDHADLPERMRNVWRLMLPALTSGPAQLPI